MPRESSIVDATVISAPSSTRNKRYQHNRIFGPSEIQQTRKGNEWHFSMKMYTGIVDMLGLNHSIDTTAANVH